VPDGDHGGAESLGGVGLSGFVGLVGLVGWLLPNGNWSGRCRGMWWTCALRELGRVLIPPVDWGILPELAEGLPKTFSACVITIGPGSLFCTDRHEGSRTRMTKGTSVCDWRLGVKELRPTGLFLAVRKRPLCTDFASNRGDWQCA